ncbi:MAG: type III secretion system translocon subunit SctE [Ramlibacter sp.]
MIDWLGELFVKSNNRGLQLAKEGVKFSQRQLEDMQAQNKRQLDEWLKNTAAAEKNKAAQDGLKWFNRIIMPVAAVLSVALTIATAGLASPLAVAAIAMTTYAMAEHISKEAGGPSLSMADGLSKGFAQLFQKVGGMSEEEAKKWGDLASGVVMVAAAAASMLRGGGVAGAGDKMAMFSKLAKFAAPMAVAMDGKFVGNMAGGAAAVAGVESDDVAIINGAVTAATQLVVSLLMMRAMTGGGKAHEMSDKTAKLVHAGGILQGTFAAASGATKIADGAMTIENAGHQRDADTLKAESEKSAAQLEEIEAMREIFMEMLKKLTEDIGAFYEVMADRESTRIQLERELTQAAAAA